MTDLWAAWLQNRLEASFAADPSAYAFGTTPPGDALMRIKIPTLDVNVIVVEGTSEAVLRAGAGHYPSSALPEENGNVALAGHRTTYGKPFNRIDELRAGDQILVTTPVARHVYQVVRRPWTVVPTDWSPVRRFPRGGSFLTLMSCHPEGNDSHRIVVRARLLHSFDEGLAEARGDRSALVRNQHVSGGS